MTTSLPGSATAVLGSPALAHPVILNPGGSPPGDRGMGRSWRRRDRGRPSSRAPQGAQSPQPQPRRPLDRNREA